MQGAGVDRKAEITSEKQVKIACTDFTFKCSISRIAHFFYFVFQLHHSQQQLGIVLFFCCAGRF
jgi:hypothetical protein